MRYAMIARAPTESPSGTRITPHHIVELRIIYNTVQLSSPYSSSTSLGQCPMG